MKHNNICLLGGTGFVGQHLANRLSRMGYRVAVLTRRSERHRSLKVNLNVQLIEANIFDCNVLQQHFKDADTVINLVGILNESRAVDMQFTSVHAELAGTIARTAVTTGVGRLLHMSALNADASEADSVYLRTKGEGENNAHAAAGKGLAVTSFRPSVIFGPGDSFFNRFATLLKITPLAFPLACPDSRFAPVYVGDVVNAFVAVLKDDASIGKRLELCGPDEYTLKQLVEYTRDTLGLKQRILGLGNGLSRLQARILGLMPGKPFSMDNYYSLQHASVCSDNALPRLGITPTPLQAVVPGYLAGRTSRGRYNTFRRHSKRN
ncbi:MAG: complex I NDUFA9 subunit family protein [Pseudomonadota bacterium]